MGLEVTPSAANFILMHFPKQPGRDADAADRFLRSRAIILRKMDAYGLPGALRMTVGTEAENHTAVAALSEFMDGSAA
jgi:histidinol-phosphate aminotransferase